MRHKRVMFLLLVGLGCSTMDKSPVVCAQNDAALKLVGAAAGSPASAMPAAVPSSAEKKHYTPIQLFKLPIGPTANITIPVQTTVNGTANTTIGSISADVTANPGHTMTTTFTVDPSVNGLCRCYEFHWVQIITADGCPATIANVVPTFPVVDPPAYGWDYMYKDLNNDGKITADERNPPQPGKTPQAQPGFESDITDNLPWYLTATEEASANQICKSYPINDTPGFCGNGGATSFKTYLVVRPIGQQSFCILAGFSWSIQPAPGANTGPTAITIAAADGTAVSNGLTNGNIGGWTVSTGCSLDCRPVAVEQRTWGSVKGLYR